MAGETVYKPRRLPRRVLVLDFDATTLITLERLLEEAGFNTTTTWNVREATRLLELECFDLIVLGDRRPEIDAHAILCRLDTLHRLVPCIVMRAQPDFYIHPRWNQLVIPLSGCTCSEVLENVNQRLKRSPATRSSGDSTSASVTSDTAERLLLRMMWGDDRAC